MAESEEQILTYAQVLALLSEQAINGSVTACMVLERALRPEGPGQEDIDAELERILGKD
jgi:hypothetical protein